MSGGAPLQMFYSTPHPPRGSVSLAVRFSAQPSRRHVLPPRSLAPRLLSSPRVLLSISTSPDFRLFAALIQMIRPSPIVAYFKTAADQAERFSEVRWNQE